MWVRRRWKILSQRRLLSLCSRQHSSHRIHLRHVSILLAIIVAYGPSPTMAGLLWFIVWQKPPHNIYHLLLHRMKIHDIARTPETIVNKKIKRLNLFELYFCVGKLHKIKFKNWKYSAGKHAQLSSFKPIFFPFVKQVCFWTTQIHNFGTSITILFLNCTFLAVVGIWDTRTSTNYTPPLKRSVVTLVTNSD